MNFFFSVVVVFFPRGGSLNATIRSSMIHHEHNPFLYILEKKIIFSLASFCFHLRFY